MCSIEVRDRLTFAHHPPSLKYELTCNYTERKRGGKERKIGSWVWIVDGIVDGIVQSRGEDRRGNRNEDDR